MKIVWSARASADVRRLHAFLEPTSPVVAERVALLLINAPDRLLGYPRLGPRVGRYEDREVRRLWVGDYEMRYEIRGEEIWIVRVWHGKELR